MIWRTDTPTEDVIVAKLTADFCVGIGRYAILYLGTQKVLGVSCVCYMEDGEEIPYSAIEKWASLEGSEINGDLEEEIARYIYDVGLPNEEELVEYLKEIARHFSNWQKEQDENSSSSVDLESKDLSDLKTL